MGKWLAVAAVVTAVTGCNYGASSFQCSSDQSCGANGKCEPNSLCSFPDGACAGGRRYGELAGTQSGKCVDGSEPPPDAPPDAEPDAPPDARVCFGTNLVNGLGNICFEAPPMGDRTIAAAAELNTDDPNMCTRVASGATGFCVIAAQTINVNANWRVFGTRPLVLFALNSITVSTSGVIDLASRRGATREIGAGGDPATCASSTGPTSANGTNGGGAGGSYVGQGGRGGNGGGGAGGIGGTAAAAVSPLGDLRGGCPGQEGQGGGASKGARGHGGGAVLLFAGGSIAVDGRIHASGEGGGGGINGEAGGGGGGAGGMIVLDAPTITGNANTLILANGGGGGEGAGTTAPQSSGDAGNDPTSEAAAPGGSGGTNSGADGGAGSAGVVATGGVGLNSTSGPGNGGGGGGGGGAGLIKISSLANLTTAKISPTPTP